MRTVPAPLCIEGAREAVAAALTGPGPRPTAIVCDDDILAAGACKAVRRLGLRVPEDVSVTGFDDLALATAVEPELTTVRLPPNGSVNAACRPCSPSSRAAPHPGRPPGRARRPRLHGADPARP